MQVPERLALIGGSILLSSTLVFTLKSQASTIIPNVSHSISGVFDHIGDAQKGNDFDSNFQDAQKNGETTGNWGTSKYYIDKGNNLHVGQGEIQGKIFEFFGQGKTDTFNSVNFDQPVQAPENSCGLLAQIHNATSINGLNNMNTDNTTDMSWMFNDNLNLRSLDISTWKTPKLNTGNHMFSNDPLMTKLDISSMNSRQANMAEMFGGDWVPIDKSLNNLITGKGTYTQNSDGLIDSNWSNGQETLNNHQLLTTFNVDNGSHPGNWHRIQ